MSLRDNELARRQEGRTELRGQPLRVRWKIADLSSRDGHELQLNFAASVRAVPDATEHRMLDEVLLGSRYAITDSDVAEHFEPALRSAAAKFAADSTALKLVSGQANDQLIDALRSAARPVAFGCGLELLPPFSIDLQSPTLQQQRLTAMQRELAEKQTAGQMQHLQRAAELLKQFESIRQAAPDLSPGMVLGQINPADRGSLLQALLLASAKQEAPPALWAVAGPYLVRVDSDRPQLFPLPPDLGPLRSVQGAQIDGANRLLIGARGGFLLVDPQNPVQVQTYADPQIKSSLGFNRVIYAGPERGFVASHSEAGLVQWAVGQTAALQSSIPPDRMPLDEPAMGSGSDQVRLAGPHHLEVLDDQWLVFSAGGQLLMTNLKEVQALPDESKAPIVAILPEEKRLLVVHDDGTLSELDRRTRQVRCLARRGGGIRAAGALPWLGSNRVLLAGHSGTVDCIGFDDPLVSQYTSPHFDLRVVRGSAANVAAISSDRQRVILWQSWDGRAPKTEVYLTGLTRHRIADIEFA